MPSSTLAIAITALLATGRTWATAEPAPATAEPAPASEPAPTTTDQAIENNGWGTPEPAPATASPTSATTVPTTAAPADAGPSEEERLWRLKQHNRFKGIMISGFTTLGAVYGASVLIGALSIDFARDDDDQRQRQYGTRMMIPLGGPFAAAPVSRSATLGVLTVAAGLGQLLGLSMGIAGAVKLKEYPNPNKPKFAFGVMPTRGGAHMGLSLRF